MKLHLKSSCQKMIPNTIPFTVSQQVRQKDSPPIESSFVDDIPISNPIFCYVVNPLPLPVIVIVGVVPTISPTIFPPNKYRFDAVEQIEYLLSSDDPLLDDCNVEMLTA